MVPFYQGENGAPALIKNEAYTGLQRAVTVELTE